jgi:hypothetical protein
MKRKLKWLAIVLAVSLLGFGTALLLWPRDRINEDSWKQIQIGMTEEEVEDILGRPGVSWEANLFPFHFELAESNDTLYIRRWPFERWESDKFWTSQRACIQVRFDPRGNISGKAFWRSAEPSFLDRLRDWLGL